MKKYFDVMIAPPLKRLEKNLEEQKQLVKKIPVLSASVCMNCKAVTMQPPYTWYCTEQCEDVGAMKADNWRSE